ncbi:hypothetical protein C8J55DRAFT_561459 [Lentinula edodes]|uniref:PHD-type domain-containing protein n=1 Tax=Lentinula lateritia TaxID=40482 RepID=A0A9W9ACS9_9AGAR|nr:hypothetical protein C8J55DRAFT_561459 [Lentinula edodes]
MNDQGIQESTSAQPLTPKKGSIVLPSMENLVGKANGSTGALDNPNAQEHLRLVSARYAHLPTPQSPNDFTYYVPGLTNGPDSPISHLSHSFASSSRSVIEPSASSSLLDGTPKRPMSKTQTFITPDSSPFASRIEAHNHVTMLSTPTRSQLPPSNGVDSLVPFFAPLIPRKTPSPSPSEHHSSGLSSPFMAKSTPRPSSNSPPNLRETTPLFTAIPNGTVSTSTISTPPVSPLHASGSLSNTTTPPISAGGELDRIHQVIQHQHDDRESRRPEYLTRAKRSFSEVDFGGLMEDENLADRERFSSIGITESPMKGRRIKLFQETSEESFEESLMAGGYGRYRTAEWVRQPQPIVVNAGTGAPVNVVAHLEEVQQQEAPSRPLTEKEIRKQKRLDAFRSSSSSASRLYPVEIEGKGRVLLDVPTEHNDIDTSLATSKKRTPGKRKRKAEPTAKERRAAAAAAAAEESAEKPNWPDAEFPWRLRTEERTEQARVEEQERLEWIEKYLDRDTDEEDDGESGSIDGGVYGGAADAEDDEVLPSSVWGVVYEDGDDQPIPYRAGRGKMVPLSGDPNQPLKFKRRRSAYFPSDPADARAALLSKKNVRVLSFRRQRSISHRKSISGNEDDQILCICRGVDDGRELVQCDSCKTWYHLDCIGIDDILELGPPDNDWFCYRCENARDSPPSVEATVPVPYTEPTFAPTDETPRRRQVDSQFFHPPVPESPTQSWSLSVPHTPKTPTRGVTSNIEFSSGFSSSSSRYGPVTPRHQARDVRIISGGGSTPGGPFDVFGSDDSRFDPTSTPSRGIKFGVPFATPNDKHTPSARVFHTPSKPSTRAGGSVPGSASFGASGFLSSALSERGSGDGTGRVESGPYPYARPSHPGAPYDDSSPIRREGHRIRRIVDPPTMSTRALFIEESPLARTKGKGRALDFGVGPHGIA